MADADPAVPSGVSIIDEPGSVGKWTAKTAPVKAACLSCRQKKAKCDGQQPVCGQCSRKSLECVFVKSRRGGARTRRPIPPPTALSEYLKKLDGLATAPMRVEISHEYNDLPVVNSFNVVQVCSSRHEILLRYYDEIHPFISVMPPRNYLDQVLTTLAPHSPFLLAAQTILALVPHPDDAAPRSSNSKHLRQCASQAFSRQCLQLTESLIETGKADLECVQALVILSLWEWSNSGSVARNRQRAGQSVQVAMDIGLHDIDKFPSGRKVEGTDWKRDMARRTWWVVYNSQLISSVVSGTAPLLGPDDNRICVDFPVCSFDDFTWPNYTETVRQCSRIFMLVNTVYYAHLHDSRQWGYVAGHITQKNKEDMKRQMLDVDQQVNAMLKQAEATNIINMVPGGEEEVVRNQQLSARLALAVVHIHIHRNQAFPEVALFSKRICGLPQAPAFPSTPSVLAPAPADKLETWPSLDASLQPDLDIINDFWVPELYPPNLPIPWFATPNGAAALYAPVNVTPQFYDICEQTSDLAVSSVSSMLPDDAAAYTSSPAMLPPPAVPASVVPISTPSSEGRAFSIGSSAYQYTKSHKAWGVDEKADKVLPPPDGDVLNIFPPGISLARCATAAHTIVRLEVLHRSAMMAMWKGPPKWMPFCACGLVTGAYAFLLLALAVHAETAFTGRSQSHSDEIEALMTNVKVILAGLEAYGVMWAGIDAMADEVRAALEAATKLPQEVQAQIEISTPSMQGTSPREGQE